MSPPPIARLGALLGDPRHSNSYFFTIIPLRIRQLSIVCLQSQITIRTLILFSCIFQGEVFQNLLVLFEA